VTTNTTRVQVPLDGDVLAVVKELAVINRRSLGSMCAELIDHALSSDQYKKGKEEDFKQEVIKAVTEGKPVHLDPRINKMLKILEMFEDEKDSN